MWVLIKEGKSVHWKKKKNWFWPEVGLGSQEVENRELCLFSGNKWYFWELLQAEMPHLRAPWVWGVLFPPFHVIPAWIQGSRSGNPVQYFKYPRCGCFIHLGQVLVLQPGAAESPTVFLCVLNWNSGMSGIVTDIPADFHQVCCGNQYFMGQIWAGCGRMRNWSRKAPLSDKSWEREEEETLKHRQTHPWGS